MAMGTTFLKERLVNKHFTKEKNCKKCLYHVLEMDSTGNILRENHGTACAVKLPRRFDSVTSGKVVLITARKVISKAENSSTVDQNCSTPGSNHNKLKVSDVRSNDELSIVMCDESGSNSKLDEVFLEVAIIPENQLDKEEVKAYTFWEDSTIQLNFKKKTVAGSFSLQNLVNVPKYFEVRKAVGAPVVRRSPDGQKFYVIGVLDCTSDGSFYPIFFTKENLNFDTPRSPSSENMDSTASPPQPIQGQQAGASVNGRDIEDSPTLTSAPPLVGASTGGVDAKDSPLAPLLAGASASGHTPTMPSAVPPLAGASVNGRDIEDSPALTSAPPLVGASTGGVDAKDSPLAPLLAGASASGHTPTMPSAVPPLGQGPLNMIQDTQPPKGEQMTNKGQQKDGGVFDKKEACVKNKRISDLPSHILIRDLKIQLDPEKPFGGDVASLAEKFGYNFGEIKYLKSLPNPTEKLLTQEDCTLNVLISNLREIGNNSALDKVDKFINNQSCNCEECGGIC